MKKRIFVYGVLALLLTVCLVYIAVEKQKPTGLARGIRTYSTEEIVEEPDQRRLMEVEREEYELEDEIIKREVVDIEDAKMQAVVGFVEKVCSESFIVDAEGWEYSILGEPIVLHDLCGLPLIYKFPVIKDENEVIGYINVSANKCLGTDIVSFEKPIEVIDQEDLMDNIIAKVHEENEEI